MGIEGVDIARTHKILHHKRPRVFPLIDNETITWLRGGESVWAAIHDELVVARPTWLRLEAAVQDLVGYRGPVLTRLRLHDILLWTHATGRWRAAHRYGADAMRSA